MTFEKTSAERKIKKIKRNGPHLTVTPIQFSENHLINSLVKSVLYYEPYQNFADTITQRDRPYDHENFPKITNECVKSNDFIVFLMLHS